MTAATGQDSEYKIMLRHFTPPPKKTYKWVTFSARSVDGFAKLAPEAQARLERAGDKLHESDF